MASRTLMDGQGCGAPGTPENVPGHVPGNVLENVPGKAPRKAQKDRAGDAGLSRGLWGLSRTPATLLPLLLVCLFLAACASKDIDAPGRAEVEAKRDALMELTKPRTVTETEGNFLQGRLVGRTRDPLDTPLMNERVTLRQKGSLREIAASIGQVSKISAHVADADDGLSEAAVPAPSSSPLPDGLEDLLPVSMPLLPKGQIEVSYEGTLRGLLDTVASLSGYGWDFDANLKRVTFQAMQTRTFALAIPAGEVTWESQVSNKSREQRSSSLGSGTNINSTVTSGDTSTQTAQTNRTNFTLDTWKEVESTVKSLLSAAGTVTVNRAAGTLVVRDTWARLEAVRRYVDDINARLSRQVALSVRVWALEVSDESSIGLNLQALFSSPDVAVSAGAAAAAGTSIATVSVLKGSLSGSSAMLSALKEKGHATQLTSASGLVMNAQPFPVQAVRRQAYLAGMTMSTSEYSQTSEITPGEVTTGFAMTVVPHIQPDRNVLLQYNITLSTLDELTTIERDTIYVQLPQVSTRAFSQRTRLKSGQTLVLAGFEQDTAQAAGTFGILQASSDHSGTKTLLVIAIELEGADNV